MAQNHSNKILGFAHFLSFALLIGALGLWIYWDFVQYNILGPPIIYLQHPAPKVTNKDENEMPLKAGEVFNVHFWYDIHNPKCPRQYTRWLRHIATGSIITLESHHGHATEMGPGYVKFQFELPRFAQPGKWEYRFKAIWRCNPIRSWMAEAAVPFHVIESVTRPDPFTGTEGDEVKRRLKKLEDLMNG